MKTFFKFWKYWFGIFFIMLIASLAIAGNENGDLPGGLVFVSFLASGFFSYKLVFKNRKGKKTLPKLDSASNVGFRVSISTSNYSENNSNDYYSKQYTSDELESHVSALASKGKGKLENNLEITLQGGIEGLEKVISSAYTSYCKNDYQGWSESVNPKVLEFAVIKYRPKVSELFNVAEKLSAAYTSMRSDLNNSRDFKDAGELDQKSILEEFEYRFTEDYVEQSFSECELNEQDFVDLFIKCHFTEDFSILGAYGHDISKKLFERCSYYLEREKGVFSIATDAYLYKDIKSLVEVGILIQGDSIAPMDLSPLLKVSDIRELAKQKNIVIKGRKKEELISNLIEHCEISHSDLGKFIALRETFGISSAFKNKHDFMSNYMTWKKYMVVASYIVSRVEHVADARFCDEKPQSAFNTEFLSKFANKKAA